jgi:hypothetical protein
MTWEMLLIAYAPWVLGTGGALYLGLRAVRAFERRAASRREMEELEERMLRLEESLGTMGERMDRLRDGQEFTTRLLAERK